MKTKISKKCFIPELWIYAANLKNAINEKCVGSIAKLNENRWLIINTKY